MATSPAILRTHFPELSDVVKYPDSVIQFWLDIAVKLHNEDRWGDLLDAGCELYAAHNTVIASMDAAQGALPGTAIQGAVTSQSVGGVSMSIDTASSSETDAGAWNLTTYGTRWIRLARMLGAGPVQVGAPTAGDTSSIVTSAWPGPYQSYF